MINEWTRKIDEQDAKIKELLKCSKEWKDIYNQEKLAKDLAEKEVTELKKTLSEISNGVSSLEGIKG